MGRERCRCQDGPQILRLALFEGPSTKSNLGNRAHSRNWETLFSGSREPFAFLGGLSEPHQIGNRIPDQVDCPGLPQRSSVDYFFRRPMDWPKRSLSAFARTPSSSCFSSAVNLSPANFSKTRAVNIERGTVTSRSFPGTILYT